MKFSGSSFEFTCNVLDEETGCYVGSGVKVKIIRRWNYENRVSAIVCRATISMFSGFQKVQVI